jgi:tRNA threonylcarbamoyladenosine biosynthesis protein TsaE
VLAELQTCAAKDTEAIGEALGAQLRLGDLVVLTGDLGTGKTTFTKGLARGLGVSERVTSPTFTIVQEYDGRVPVAHVDVYRLERIQELHDFGFEELLDSRVTVVEWGEAIELVLPRDRMDVRIAMDEARGDDARVVEVAATGSSWNARRAALEDALRPFGGA